MDTAQIIVTVGGVLLIALILWFFFGPRQGTVAGANRSGVQGATHHPQPRQGRQRVAHGASRGTWENSD